MKKKLKTASDFLSEFVAPARRALENEGITSAPQLARYSEREILQLHGMGASSLPALRRLLKEKGLKFKLR
jgi:DNA-directed RNA polymerase alpha subunit